MRNMTCFFSCCYHLPLWGWCSPNYTSCWGGRV